MDKVRILPPDPMEATQLPVDDADPTTAPDGAPSGSTASDQSAQPDKPYVENEGLDGAPTQPRQDIERSGAS